MMNKVKMLLTSTLETIWGVGAGVAAGTLLERLYNLVPWRASFPDCQRLRAPLPDSAMPARR